MKENELFTKVSDLFIRFGIKSLTMDAISSKMGISKKTLYKFVKDKNDLVYKCMTQSRTANESDMQTACLNADNAIEELILTGRIASEKIKDIHPSIFYDLQQYYPEAWEVFKKFKQDYIYKVTLNNLKRGIAEKLYRDDINIEIVASIYVSVIGNIFDNNLVTPDNVTLYDLHREVFAYHLRGVVNKNGMELMEKYLSDSNLKLG